MNIINEVHFPQTDEDIDKIIDVINKVTKHIQLINTQFLMRNSVETKDFELLIENIKKVLNFWTGRTYVGYKKEKKLQRAFQKFYESLYDFIYICRGINYKGIQDFANDVLYCGRLYRYIGYGEPNNSNINQKIEPQFNRIYVSWSKNNQNNYIEQKLYGTKTLLVCEVVKPYYGIDLEVFGVSKSKEAEVVFPTIKHLITDIRYIYNDDIED